MEKKKRERLEKAGWKIGGPKEFLGLSEEDSRCIELKLAGCIRGELRRSREERRS